MNLSTQLAKVEKNLWISEDDTLLKLKVRCQIVSKLWEPRAYEFGFSTVHDDDHEWRVIHKINRLDQETANGTENEKLFHAFNDIMYQHRLYRLVTTLTNKGKCLMVAPFFEGYEDGLAMVYADLNVLDSNLEDRIDQDLRENLKKTRIFDERKRTGFRELMDYYRH